MLQGILLESRRFFPDRNIELCELESVEELLDLKKEFELVAVEITSDSIPYTEYRPMRPPALVLGNEKEGISPEVLEVIDRAVHIPMYGRGSSMNVSMAAGIVVYGLLPHLP
jgi:tRNA G18 (ribose-2'-O)-methylase SpoU